MESFLPMDNRELFLKIIKNPSDVEILHNAITSKKIDCLKTESIILNYYEKLKKNLLKRDHSLKDHETRVLLECFFDLLDCKGYLRELKWMTLTLYEIFVTTSRYDYSALDNPLQFPVEIHLKALDVCGRFINRQLDMDTIKHVLNSFERLIDHKDLSADQQMEIFRFLQPFEGSKNYAAILSRSATIEHASPYFRAFVIQKLLKFALNKHENEFARHVIIDNLPFNEGFLNIDIKFINESVVTLINLIKNDCEVKHLRETAIQQLSAWLRTDQKNQTGLTEEQKNSIDCLVKLIREDDSQKIRDLCAQSLFKDISRASDSDHVAQYLTEPFKNLLDDNKVNLSTKIKLVHCMPGIFRPIKEPRVLKFYFFMLDRLSQERYPTELRRIYTEYLIGCYFNKDSCEYLGIHAPQLATVEQLLNLEIFKLNEDLGSTAKIAFEKFNNEKQKKDASCTPFLIIRI